jgi:hypothetical protein
VSLKECRRLEQVVELERRLKLTLPLGAKQCAVQRCLVDSNRIVDHRLEKVYQLVA